MATRKRTKQEGSENGGADARAFTVAVEALRGDVKVVAEAVMGLDARMTAGFQEVDRRFEAVDRRFDGIDRELAWVKADLAVVKTDLTEVKTDLAVVQTDRWRAN